MKRRVFAFGVAAIGAALVAGALVAAAPKPAQPRVFPVNSRPYGHSYAEWSAKWWQWALELPLDGHPFLDSPDFQVAEGQSGSVWFLAAPLPGPSVRTCTIPAGKALFVGLINSEWSSLEGFATEAEQRETAEFFGDHIVGVFCTLDGVAVANLSGFRFQSPQFTFTAPTPWIFGDTGGAGTSVADGYYVLLEPLPTGQHVLHFGGAFHLAVAEGDPFDYDAAVDMTYNLTVAP
jgi:hypothetical protein